LCFVTRIARFMLWKVTERSEMVGFKIPAYRGIMPLEIEIAEALIPTII
jgi:hypothetical protein